MFVNEFVNEWINAEKNGDVQLLTDLLNEDFIGVGQSALFYLNNNG